MAKHLGRHLREVYITNTLFCNMVIAHPKTLSLIIKFSKTIFVFERYWAIDRINTSRFKSAKKFIQLSVGI